MTPHGDVRDYFALVIEHWVGNRPPPRVPDSFYRSGKNAPIPRQVQDAPIPRGWSGSWNYPKLAVFAMHMAGESTPEVPYPRTWIVDQLTHEVESQEYGFMGRELLARGYGDWVCNGTIAVYWWATLNGDVELSDLCAKWLKSYFLIMALASWPVPTKYEKKMWSAPFVATPGQRTPEHKLEGTALGLTFAMVAGLPINIKGKRPKQHNAFQWFRNSAMLKDKWVHLHFGLVGWEGMNLRRLAKGVWEPNCLNMWQCAGIRRPVHLYRTEEGVCGWFEGAQLHSEKGVAGAVKAVAWEGAARAQWTRPYTRRGKGPSRTTRMGNTIIQDGPTGTETLTLPKGELLWHVVIDNDGARRIA